ncbi:MAG: hypothetical protein VB024_11610 [Dysgonamonadaceae bacterium]|nr:hypothetical protein [Dysgonamonadaceae bacterium]
MQEEKEIMQPAIYQDVVDSYRSKEGETYEEIRANVLADYERKVKAYLPGEPAFSGDPAGADAQKKREEFKRKMQIKGRL